MRNESVALRSVPSLPPATRTAHDESSLLLGDVGAERIAALHAWLLAAAKPETTPLGSTPCEPWKRSRRPAWQCRPRCWSSCTTMPCRPRASMPRTRPGTTDSAGRQIPVTIKSAERDATVSAAQQAARALRLSPSRTRKLLGAARVWHEEMPHTLTALREGRLSEERALLLVKETACLTLEDRARYRRGPVCRPGHPGRCRHPETGRPDHRARQPDRPAALVKRAAKATSDRCVTIRPAPDTMTYVTALLPVAQGVQVYAALKLAAESARHTAGDERSTGQIMADTLVERVTGQGRAADVPVTVNLVVSDAALLGGGHEPAVVLDAAGAGAGHGTIPAAIARNLIAGALDLDAAWLRTIYATTTGDLIGTTSRQRLFARGLADLLRIRDQGLCRTPWCDAPIRRSTTSNRRPAAATPACPTGKGSALPATRPRRPPAGDRYQAPTRRPAGTSSPPPRRPDTCTGRSPRRPRAGPPQATNQKRSSRVAWFEQYAASTAAGFDPRAHRRLIKGASGQSISSSPAPSSYSYLSRQAPAPGLPHAEPVLEIGRALNRIQRQLLAVERPVAVVVRNHELVCDLDGCGLRALTCDAIAARRRRHGDGKTDHRGQREHQDDCYDPCNDAHRARLDAACPIEDHARQRNERPQRDPHLASYAIRAAMLAGPPSRVDEMLPCQIQMLVTNI